MAPWKLFLFFNCVTVLFLPPDTTQKIQPLDAGIIASVMVRYLNIQMERAVDIIDENVQNIYKVDILSAMRALKRLWEDLPSEIIEECWRHTDICQNSELCSDAIGPEDILTAQREALRISIEEIVPIRARMAIDKSLNASGEEECTDVYKNR